MTPPDLLRQRLLTQHVIGTPLDRPEDVVQLLGAVQSQDYLGAKWSVAQRVKAGTDAAIDEALNSGRILRTHILRPTWFFVAPEDLRWMQALTSPHVHRLSAYWYRVRELDEKLLARCRKLIASGLTGGNHLTRDEVGEMLARNGIVAQRERLAAIMMNAELHAVVCSGVMKGKLQTYALVDERVPDTKPLTRDEALAQLARRFFSGHSPATVKHFVWWSGLSVADTRKAIAMIRHELDDELVEGHPEWLGVESPSVRKGKPEALLIPEYDEALVGSKDMNVPELSRSRRQPKDAFPRPLFVDGKRAGTWRRTFTPKGVVLETRPLATLDVTQRQALERVAGRYGMFLDMPVTLA